MMGEWTRRVEAILGTSAALACGTFALKANGASVLGLVSTVAVAVGIVLILSVVLTPLRETQGGGVFLCVGAGLTLVGAKDAFSQPFTVLGALAILGMGCAVVLAAVTLVAAVNRTAGQTREEW